MKYHKFDWYKCEVRIYLRGKTLSKLTAVKQKSNMENYIFVMSSINASQIPVGVLLPSVYATIY